MSCAGVAAAEFARIPRLAQEKAPGFSGGSAMAKPA